MVKEVKMYTLICDGCGSDLNSGFGESVAWSDIDSNVVIAADSAWITIGDKHYCADCWEIDDTGERVPSRQVGLHFK